MGTRDTDTEIVRLSDTRDTTVARISETEVTRTTGMSLVAARETELDRRSNIDDFIDSVRESVAFEDDTQGHDQSSGDLDSIIIESKIGVTPEVI